LSVLKTKTKTRGERTMEEGRGERMDVVEDQTKATCENLRLGEGDPKPKRA
jgi:hypothetical protein